jgi:membrane-bound lytic murein transglycosylase B
MSAPRFGRFQKATALLPLALLSAAVTASFAGLGPTTTAAADPEGATALPDGTAVPAQAIEAPASVSAPGVVAPGLGTSKARQVAAHASASGIPAAALAAYQRAETVINAADKSCNLPWQLVAAIGRVESDHGRVHGNTLDDEGVARPGIYGIALDGKNHTRAIRDTDAGQYDADARWDRAVGPMQFIPSTWSVVGVDGDNDGRRNPQDIDDAALSSAVYLCSGRDDLSRIVGQRAAVFRYNHSHAYVDLVLSYMRAYMSGDYTAVPNSLTSVGDSFAPAPTPQGGGKGPGDGSGSPGGTGGQDADIGPGGDNAPGGPGGGNPGPKDPGGGGQVPDLPAPDLPDVGDPDVDNNADPVSDTLTQAEALAQCLADGVIDLPLTGVNELTQCVNGLLDA